MPFRTPVLLAISAAVALSVGACGRQQEPPGASPGGPSESSSPSWSPGLSVVGSVTGVRASELEPTGWRLAGVPLPEDYVMSAWFNDAAAMVADGANHVWVRTAWEVARIDAQTGESKSWDVGNDAVFASPGLILAPAQGSGVWLLDGGRIRLFDGDRFAVDLQVPADVLDVTDAAGVIQGTVEDVVERGAELWLSIHAQRVSETSGEECGGRVVRWSDGQWFEMSTLADGASGDLTVDSEGQVWAGGRLVNPEGYEQGVRRWDGAHWALPEAGSAEAPSRTYPAVGTVEADGSGGVWFLEWGDGGRLYRFDGTAWDSRSVAGGNMSLAVGRDGDAWVTRGDSGDSVTRASVDGAMQVIGPEPGLSTYPNAIQVTSGGEVLVLTQQGALRLSGDSWTRIWQDYLTPYFGTLVAVSKDEVWALDAGGSPSRFDGDEWHGTGLTGGCSAVVATDAAVWVPTPEGLERQTATRRRVVTTRTDICRDMLAGVGGSVWVPDDSGVTRYSAVGARRTIPWPGLTDHECLKATGSDGSVWVSAETDPGESGCDDPNGLSRWDGRRWTRVKAPPGEALGQMAVTDDGAAWMASYPGDFLGRYADGRWALIDVDRLSRLTAVPGGRICGMEQSDPNSSYGDAIVCYDPEDEVARIDVQGMGVSAFSVAPDGAIWVLGSQVARLAETLPVS